MREMLEARNRAMLADLERLIAALVAASVPPELHPYRERLLVVCQRLRVLTDRNLADLALGRDAILEDVLSNTQQIMQSVRLLSARMAAPVLRASSHDRPSLLTIRWLHQVHPETARLPAAFADGDCSIWPFLDIAPIYFFPCLEQRGLLYQPLYFHEFGHVLYVCHRQEMDDLVRDMQREVEAVLIPPSQRNDRHADVQAARRQTIVDTWYLWAQELFCDAVGWTIGGPCFLLAFSRYLGTMQRGDFYRQPADLENSAHPVTWLRVQLLAERARATGCSNLAGQVEREWLTVAHTMGIAEDYHGFYDPAFRHALIQTLGDMLTEAAPRHHTAEDARGDGWGDRPVRPVALLNKAWHLYQTGPASYPAWEQETLRGLTTS